MFANFDVPLSWGELFKRTFKDSIADDALGLAAQLAYYFFLSLFPALLFLLALASFFPLGQFTDMLPNMLGAFAAPQMVDLIRNQLQELSNRDNGGLLSIGLLGAVWSSSSAMVSIANALNRAYDIEESRPWWKVRLTAIVLTIGVALFILVSFTLVVAGPQLADLVANRVGFGPAFEWTWKILQWPLVFILVVIGIGLIYYFGPDAEQEWVWVTPGAVLGTALWLLASLVFRLYVVNFGNYDETYGTLGAIILLMLWFYLTGLSIIVGAELSAEIEHASPWGKAPGQKVPGQKKKIGVAAAREYRERQRLAASPPPGAPVLAPQHYRPQARSWASALLRIAAFVAAVFSMGRQVRG